MSINKVTLLGNLGADPDVRSLPNGGKVVNLSIATSERWKDKQSGEQREKTEWHRVVIFDERLAKLAESYLRKGNKVYLEGQLQTRKWKDNNNVEKYSTEVVLQGFHSRIDLIDKNEDGGSSNNSGGNSGGGSSRPKREDSGGFGGGGMDDDIPFAPQVD